MIFKTRAVLLSIALLLFVVTLFAWPVRFARATSDYDVMGDFPAFDTLNADPVVTSRYLRTTIDEGTVEERGILSELAAKLKEWWQGIIKWLGWSKVSDFEGLKKSISSAQLVRPNSVEEQIKKVSSRYSILTVTKIVEAEATVSEDIMQFVLKLIDYHYERWYEKKMSARAVHKLIKLPRDPALLECSLVWIWVDYAIQVDNKFSDENTFAMFLEMFGSDAVLSKMFAEAPKNFDPSDRIFKMQEEYKTYRLTRVETTPEGP